jgi:hypothetical protein
MVNDGGGWWQKVGEVRPLGGGQDGYGADDPALETCLYSLVVKPWLLLGRSRCLAMAAMSDHHLVGLARFGGGSLLTCKTAVLPSRRVRRQERSQTQIILYIDKDSQEWLTSTVQY